MNPNRPFLVQLFGNDTITFADYEWVAWLGFNPTQENGESDG
jgi:hypothetical protein